MGEDSELQDKNEGELAEMQKSQPTDPVLLRITDNGPLIAAVLVAVVLFIIVVFIVVDVSRKVGNVADETPVRTPSDLTIEEKRAILETMRANRDETQENSISTEAKQDILVSLRANRAEEPVGEQISTQDKIDILRAMRDGR